MAALAGYNGQVRVSTSVALDVQKWSLDLEMELLETTNLNTSSGSKTVLPGLYGASGTIEANFNSADTTGQKALHDAFFARTAVTLNLDTNATGSLRTYSGSAFISKLSPAVDVGDMASISFDFTFNGVVTFA